MEYYGYAFSSGMKDCMMISLESDADNKSVIPTMEKIFEAKFGTSCYRVVCCPENEMINIGKIYHTEQVVEAFTPHVKIDQKHQSIIGDRVTRKRKRGVIAIEDVCNTSTITTDNTPTNVVTGTFSE
jgi:hypothetical protein